MPWMMSGSIAASEVEPSTIEEPTGVVAAEAAAASSLAETLLPATEVEVTLLEDVAAAEALSVESLVDECSILTSFSFALVYLCSDVPTVEVTAAEVGEGAEPERPLFKTMLSSAIA